MPRRWGVRPVLALAWGLCQTHGTLDLYFWTKWCFWDAEGADTCMVKTSPTTTWPACPRCLAAAVDTHLRQGTDSHIALPPSARAPEWRGEDAVCARSSGARMGPRDTHHIPEGGAQLSPEREPLGGIRKGRRSSGGPQLPLWESDSHPYRASPCSGQDGGETRETQHTVTRGDALSPNVLLKHSAQLGLRWAGCTCREAQPTRHLKSASTHAATAEHGCARGSRLSP